MQVEVPLYIQLVLEPSLNGALKEGRELEGGRVDGARFEWYGWEKR
jgi:hypothetical protein